MKQDAPRFRIDDLVIDTGTRRVTRGDIDLQVTGLSFDLLLALGEVAPNLLSADGINRRVWPGQVVSPETISQRIRMVRQLLGDDAVNPRYIAGLRGYGYRALSPMSTLPVASRSTGMDSGAKELYLQGRAVMRGTTQSKDEAVGFLDQALGLDPDLAPALAHRALLHAGSVLLSGAPRATLDAAGRDARRALALDASQADALVALGVIRADQHLWVDAHAYFVAARAADPANAFVSNLHALVVLRPTGQLVAALQQLTETYRRVPADGFTLHELILTHSLLGKDMEARRYSALSQTLSGIPAPPWDVQLALARAATRRGAFSEAEMLTLRAFPQALGDEQVARALHAYYGALEDPSRVSAGSRALRAIGPRLKATAVDGRTRAFVVAAIATLGDLDGAFSLLDELLFPAAGERSSVDLSDLWCPEMRAFRAHSRFRTLVRRLGLADYWRNTNTAPQDPSALS